ncbi:MAG: energy transducer TonB, partial [Pyrinomonadaceae bacterium]
QDKIYQPDQVTKRARILQKPGPSYTDRAREAGVKGTVMLQAVFGADGTVRSVDPISSLSGGLTEEAIRVARMITFVPATIDGRPVSQYIKLEYRFDIY